MEALRDSLLFVAGNLDLKAGGPAVPLDDENKRRTVYGFVSRRKLDGMLALFDFPNPNSTSEQRIVTNVPLQRLFFMNSSFVEAQAARPGRPAHRRRTREPHSARRIALLFGRQPVAEEMQLGLEFLQEQEPGPQYARVLLSSNEFEWIC